MSYVNYNFVLVFFSDLTVSVISLPEKPQMSIILFGSSKKKKWTVQGVWWFDGVWKFDGNTTLTLKEKSIINILRKKNVSLLCGSVLTGSLKG